MEVDKLSMIKLRACQFFILAGLMFVTGVTASAAAAVQQYRISVDPVSLMLTPRSDASVVHQFYQANRVVILAFEGKWVKISFQEQGSDYIGWVEKTHLQPLKPSSSRQSTDSDLTKSQVANSAVVSVKAINSDLHCMKSGSVQPTSGCVVDVDIEINAAKEMAAVLVSCEVDFDITYVDQEIEKRTIAKRIRTPLKNKVGAARLQIALLPLSDRKIKQIKKADHSCKVESVL